MIRPEEVPDHLVVTMARAVYESRRLAAKTTSGVRGVEPFDASSALGAELIEEQRVALAAVLPRLRAQAHVDAASAMPHAWRRGKNGPAGWLAAWAETGLQRSAGDE